MRFTFLRVTSAALVAVTPALVSITGIAGVTSPAHASAPVSLHVSFRPASLAAPAGYMADTGAGFNGTSGWQTLTGAPLDLTANTRSRTSPLNPDARYSAFVQAQETPLSAGVLTPGRWATNLANGRYDVTVGVGDATHVDSVDEVTAQYGTANAIAIVDHFVPTAAAPFATRTARVLVTDGLLVLDPSGGSNTKLDFVDVVPVPDTTAPTVTLAASGPLSTGTTTAYTGPVTVTATSTDDIGVTASSFAVDGGAAQPYTAPVVVGALGAHTVTVTATDAAGNVGATTTAFSIVPTSIHVNFAPATSAPYAGYVTDSGAAFDPASGTGWESAVDGTPLSYAANARERNLAASPDKRYDTQIMMQEQPTSVGVKTHGQWEHAIANGTYDVTVGVGDASAIDSIDRIVAEPGAGAVVVVNNFLPTTATPIKTATAIVKVTDGRLTLNAEGGGANTKLDFVDAIVDIPPVQSAPSRVVGRLSPATGAWFGATPDNAGAGLWDSQWESWTLAREAKVGRAWDIVNTFPGWGGNIATARVKWTIAQGRIPMISWDSPTNVTDQQIIDGTQDANIKAQAANLKSLGVPVFLRFDWEMNGNWFVWDGTHNNTPGTTDGPSKYVAMWRHVHDLFTAAGATNVVWVWCPSVADLPAGKGAEWNHWSQYYPGDAYVDWASVDNYNWAGAPGYSDWAEFGPKLAPFYADFGTRKPIVIAETGAGEEAGHDKGAWMTNMRTALKSQFPDVQAVDYYDLNYQNDWLFDTSASSLAGYAAMGADPYFNPLNRPDSFVPAS
ncbi:hypothetical protein acdb102_13710 [Acidothermaceae bacterium B102]|nr:hypothetical protein acdb102_13710 [Acidothermaceae bacterium B102]